MYKFFFVYYAYKKGKFSIININLCSDIIFKFVLLYYLRKAFKRKTFKEMIKYFRVFILVLCIKSISFVICLNI